VRVTVIAETKLTPEFYELEQVKRARPDQLCGTDSEVLAEFAGRVCYDSFGVGRDSDGFAANIVEHGHFNVLYHPHYSMFIEGVSRNLSHELVRHHVGFSPSQRSTRYCDESESPVVHHPQVQAIDAKYVGVKRRIDEFETAMRLAYNAVVDTLTEQGCDRKTAQGAAARILPNGIETVLVWSGNLYAFMSMLERRTALVADEEFRLLGVEMLREITAKAPRYFRPLAIKCGLIDEVKS
jgi:thymidylate synthase (FAD)